MTRVHSHSSKTRDHRTVENHELDPMDKDIVQAIRAKFPDFVPQDKVHLHRRGGQDKWLR